MADVEFLELAGKINEDARGFSFFPWQGQVLDPQEVLRTCHLVSIGPGQTRGNHLHPGHEEWLFTFHGAGVIVWEAAGQRRERLVAPGRTLIRIPPGVAHALSNPGPELLYLLAWRQVAGGGPTEPESVPKTITGE